MEKQIRILRIALAVLVLYSLIITAAIIGIYQLIKKDYNETGIIRTKGIVIEDEEGKARILIGAPIPIVSERIRTDTTKVRQNWASRFTPKEDWFMEMYSEYNHSTNGILFLGKNGHDRMAIGDPVPDLWFGKRIGPSTGIIIQDSTGLERTGYGLLNVEGVYRANLGFDYPGKEGMTLSLDDGGVTGISIRDAHKSIFIGKADTTNWYTEKNVPFNGILIKDSMGLKYNFNSLVKKATITNKE